MPKYNCNTFGKNPSALYAVIFRPFMHNVFPTDGFLYMNLLHETFSRHAHVLSASLVVVIVASGLYYHCLLLWDTICVIFYLWLTMSYDEEARKKGLLASGLIYTGHTPSLYCSLFMGFSLVLMSQGENNNSGKNKNNNEL